MAYLIKVDQKIEPNSQLPQPFPAGLSYQNLISPHQPDQKKKLKQKAQHRASHPNPTQAPNFNLTNVQN